MIARAFAIMAMRLAPHRPKTDAERVAFLDGLGLDRQAIAALLGIQPEAVSSRLWEVRRATGRRRRARGQG